MESTRALVVRTDGPDGTRAVGVALARSLPAGATVSLEGPLGAGKTVLVRGLCEGLGIADDVTSPSYTLVNEYTAANGRRMIHVDCFRLDGASQLEDLGLEDRRDDRTVMVVEWGDRVLSVLPADTIRVSVEPDATNENVRRIAVRVPAGVDVPGLDGAPGTDAGAPSGSGAAARAEEDGP
jgi:tRNA threonylcarbamoyladenosine biosynthesis protein TsaE